MYPMGNKTVLQIGLVVGNLAYCLSFSINTFFSPETLL